MTLNGYYKTLPTHTAPKKSFIAEVAQRCGVSEQTVRNWCIYGMKPNNYKHIRILSEITGIKEEDLWQ